MKLSKGKIWLVIKKHFLAERDLLDCGMISPGKCLELRHLSCFRWGWAKHWRIDSNARMHLTPSLIPLLFTVAFHILSKGMTRPFSLLLNVHVYIVVLGLQMHCYSQRGLFFCPHLLVPGLGYSKATSALHGSKGGCRTGAVWTTPLHRRVTPWYTTLSGHAEVSCLGQSQPMATRLRSSSIPALINCWS